MSQHSLAEAKEHLEDLIARAERGEPVVITRDGRAVAEIKLPAGVAPADRTVTDADLDWLAARRAGRGRPREDAGALVSRMRDEDWV